MRIPSLHSVLSSKRPTETNMAAYMKSVVQGRKSTTWKKMTHSWALQTAMAGQTEPSPSSLEVWSPSTSYGSSECQRCQDTKWRGSGCNYASVSWNVFLLVSCSPGSEFFFQE
ncbi:hypothetical protein GDO86_010567 [Hymenochirus boettgeri]|uniref:Uncharacterized protein n=1 Tax=Hymenochirus boettgeri TaxID=247094 RepID=A0A8T2JPY1_9PIPI|nr:hypothetical protein GDO86_010567 [Hymenochirus boettgeri]